MLAVAAGARRRRDPRRRHRPDRRSRSEPARSSGGCPTRSARGPSLTARETLVVTGRLYGMPRTAASRARRRAAARRSDSTDLGATPLRGCSRAGRSSGSAWRARSCTTRTCCCSTSPRRASTRRRASICAHSCAASPPRGARSSSRATSSRSSKRSSTMRCSSSRARPSAAERVAGGRGAERALVAHPHRRCAASGRRCGIRRAALSAATPRSVLVDRRDVLVAFAIRGRSRCGAARARDGAGSRWSSSRPRRARSSTPSSTSAQAATRRSAARLARTRHPGRRPGMSAQRIGTLVRLLS